MRTLLSLGALLLPGAAMTARVDDRPNFLVVFADDLGYGDLSCYGNGALETSHLDRLAAEGLRLTDFYAGAPNCSPSRASLLTGRAAARVGFYDYLSRKFATDMELLPAELTLAELLRDAGYETYHAGKWHLTEKSPDQPATDHGFEHSVAAKTATVMVENFGAWLRGREAEARPFFAYLAPWECHEPVEPRSPARLQKAYAQQARELQRSSPGRARQGDPRAYLGCLGQLDEAVGILMEQLVATGNDERTLVFFASDNGPLRGTADSWGSKGSFRGSKGDLYEGGLRVPGMLRWPGHIPAGSVSHVPTHVWDVLPTFCELAGVSLPEDLTIDGASLVPLFHDGPLQRETPLFWSCIGSRGNHVALREGRWKLLAEYEPPPDERPVLEHLRGSGLVEYELFDLESDDAERTNLAESEPEVLQRLATRLAEVNADVLAEGPTFDLEAYRSRFHLAGRR